MKKSPRFYRNTEVFLPPESYAKPVQCEKFYC
jgi:hypothetical protein